MAKSKPKSQSRSKTVKPKAKARSPKSHSKPSAKSKASSSKIDDALTKMNPQLQKRMDQIRGAMDPSMVGDFKAMAIRVLDRARAFTENLRIRGKASSVKPARKGKS